MNLSIAQLQQFLCSENQLAANTWATLKGGDNTPTPPPPSNPITEPGTSDRR